MAERASMEEKERMRQEKKRSEKKSSNAGIEPATS